MKYTSSYFFQFAPFSWETSHAHLNVAKNSVEPLGNLDSHTLPVILVQCSFLIAFITSLFTLLFIFGTNLLYYIIRSVLRFKLRSNGCDLLFFAMVIFTWYREKSMIYDFWRRRDKICSMKCAGLLLAASSYARGKSLREFTISAVTSRGPAQLFFFTIRAVHVRIFPPRTSPSESRSTMPRACDKRQLSRRMRTETGAHVTCGGHTSLWAIRLIGNGSFLRKIDKGTLEISVYNYIRE